MEFDGLTILRATVIIGAIYAALNWRTLDDGVKLMVKIAGAIFVWLIPMFIFEIEGWFQLSWFMLGMTIGVTIVTRADGAPWVNWGNAFFILACSLTFVLGILGV